MIIMATNMTGSRSPSPSSTNTFGNSNSSDALPNNNKFPCRLHRMLDNAEREKFDHIVSWLKCGKAFAIHDKERFMRRVIPLYFPRMTSYKSFRRQLSLYGIYQRRIPAIRKSKKKEGSSKSSLKHQEGAPTGVYAHPLLVRGDVRSCGLLSRPSSSPKFTPSHPSAGTEAAAEYDEDHAHQHELARVPSTTSSASSSSSMTLLDQAQVASHTTTPTPTSSRINKMFDLKNLKEEESRNSALAFFGAAASSTSASSLLGAATSRPRSISHDVEAVLFSDDAGNRFQGASFTSGSQGISNGQEQRRSLLQEFPDVASLLFPSSSTTTSAAAPPAISSSTASSSSTTAATKMNIEDCFLLDSPSPRSIGQQGESATPSSSTPTLRMMASSSKPNAKDIVDEIIFTFLR